MPATCRSVRRAHSPRGRKAPPTGGPMHSLHTIWQALVAALVFVLAAGPARAEPDEARQQEIRAAVEAATAAAIKARSDIKFAGQAVLKLPAGMVYIPQPAA